MARKFKRGICITYEVWNALVSSCRSSPLGLMVNIMVFGMPTA